MRVQRERGAGPAARSASAWSVAALQPPAQPPEWTSLFSLFKEEPRKVCFTYDLFLNLEGNPPVNHLRCEKLTFNNPTVEFRYKLLMAGGVSVPLHMPQHGPQCWAALVLGAPRGSPACGWAPRTQRGRLHGWRPAALDGTQASRVCARVLSAARD